jgi:hypothetical protein
MAIVLLLICFCSVYFSLGILLPSIGSKKELLLINVLVFSVVLVLITELLSLTHFLNFTALFIAWGTVIVLNSCYLFFNKHKLPEFNRGLRQAFSQTLSGLKGYEKLMLGFAALVLLMIFAQGILYPPNNWDAMTYHMARISSWISHGSVAHYPTDIFRQLYQPPFAEFVIMHFDVLAGNDYFSNTVQFIFLLFTIVGIAVIADLFALGRAFKIAGIIMAMAIPEVILQAASTQNDIVVSFFIITSFYFAVKTGKDAKHINFILLGLATGLAALTKGTAYLFLTPVFLFWGVWVLINLFKTKNYNYLWLPFITIVFFIGVNSGHYIRNYKLTGSALGVDKQESQTYSNQKISAGLLLSGMVKNAGLHLGFMYIKPLEPLADTVIHKIHSAAGIDINDPAVNYRNAIFTVKSGITDEDSAPNLAQLIFMITAFFILGWKVFKQKDMVITGLLLVLLAQIVLFCLYLKWQPWNSRLHTTLFLMSVPLVCYAISINKTFRQVFYVFVPVILAYAFLVSLHSDKRPYTGAISDARFYKYFRGNKPAYSEYDVVKKSINAANFKNIGLILDVDSWQYPLFYDCFSRQINPVYISVNNLTKSLPNPITSIDCIVSATINRPYIDYKGQRFYNQSVNNKIIYFYR